uniref:Ig-like domain-containing protein n=1 Tax=Gasterosteus aculeatus aculeatus TaxID=481459 RepID=A0AAQ4QCF7_GASAC
MGPTLFGVFGLFLLNILYCGHAQDALLHVETNWSPLFTGETVTFICDPRDGKDTDWSYSFRRNGYAFTTERPTKYTSPPLSKEEEYQCVAHHKITPFVTRESNKVSLNLSDVHRPNLTVSPSWTSPGGSVTLTCSVEPPSAGWRFFWYQAVPELPFTSYTYELLPGNTTGTEQDSYILHGQTHTAGYACRAGRGDPVFYTSYSRLMFVWSGDVNPAASLTVSPHRLQHFSTESLTLSCEGTSTEWRVMWANKNYIALSCSDMWKMTGSTCNTDTAAMSGVYWCESETQFSNAVNITIHSGDVILVSPVRPVTEGHSVTLGCKLRTEDVLYNVEFYKNDKLISNHTKGDLLISAVKESDEGFYKCSGSKSPQGLENVTSAASWLSVKYPEEAASSSVFPVLLVVGLISGVLLILMLLFLCRYRKSKGSHVSRSQRTNQSPATDHMINQGDTQDGHYDESSLTYSVVKFKKPKKKGKLDEPDESPVYPDVRIASAADDNVTYSQVHLRTEKKNNEGKSRCVAEEETVHSSNQEHLINKDVGVDQTAQHEQPSL